MFSAIKTKNSCHQPSVSMVCNNGLLKSLNNISCGITIGKPRMAMSAAFPSAFPAMAANNVNKLLKLNPPIRTTNTNFAKCKVGFPRNNIKSNSAMLLIISIKTPL